MTDLNFDRDHLWHPYASATTPGPVHLVTGAEGVRLTLEDGRELIDAMSSWWCSIHGYGQPAIVQAICNQAQTMAHVMFGGLTHVPAIRLGQQLLAITPSGLKQIFYCDSGSVSVEVALKLAVQYQVAQGKRGKVHFATPRGGYHGDTWKAMSVCDPVTGMHQIFTGALSPQYFCAQPPLRYGADWVEDEAQNGLGDLRRLLEAHHTQIAGLILEPVVQGAGGMYFYHPTYLTRARALCDAFDVLLIFDEIATGFGRTGRMFATEMTGVRPDILCLGKALSGGAMSFAATLTTDAIALAISAAAPGVFMHGPTFMANPLACAAASASLSLLDTTPWQSRVAAIEAQLQTELRPARSLSGVKDVRVLGAIGVIEMDHEVSAAQAHPLCKGLGVWLRPFGRNIYCMPPFITVADDLSQISHAMFELAKVL